MAENFSDLADEELNGRLAALVQRMKPLQAELDEIRAERDQVLTELRRRERLSAMASRRDLKGAMRAGQLPTLVDLVSSATAGTFDDYVYNLKTGGEVRLGFPGARGQSITFTDGRQIGQARDLAECARYYGAGWDFGAPGKPGLRIHFPGTRTERLVTPLEVFARPVDG